MSPNRSFAHELREYAEPGRAQRARAGFLARRSRLPALGLWTLAVCVQAGCVEQGGEGLPGDVAPVRAPGLEAAVSGSSDEGVRIRLGTEGTDGEVWFSRVVGARASRDGSLLAVLSDAPPYVTIFEDGVLRSRFMERGRGPGEAVWLNSIGLSSDDSRIAVVHDRGTLTEFDLDGSLLRSQRFEAVGPLIIHGVCPGYWEVIGPDRASGLPRPVVHRIAIDSDPPSVVPVYRDPADVVHLVPPGGPAAILRDTTRSIVQYGYSSEPFIGSFDCDGGTNQVVPHPRTAPIVTRLERIASQEESGADSFGFDPRTRLSGGFLAGRGQTVLVETWTEAFSPTRIEPRSELVIFAGDSLLRRVRLELSLRILDYQPGVGVLVSIPEPVPTVILLDEDAWWQWLSETDRTP
jgi:hypothetical protein